MCIQISRRYDEERSKRRTLGQRPYRKLREGKQRKKEKEVKKTREINIHSSKRCDKERGRTTLGHIQNKT